MPEEQMQPEVAPVSSKNPWKTLGVVFILLFIVSTIFAVSYSMQDTADERVTELREEISRLNSEVETLRGVLSNRPPLEEEEIEALFKHFRKLMYSPMANSKDLINLHQVVELYYKNRN